MSKDAIVAAQNYSLAIPVDELAEIITANMDDQVGVGDLTRIVNPGGKSTKWEVPTADGDVEAVSEIEGVIVMHKLSRARWAGEYKGGGEAPLCRSVDGFTGEGEPGGVCGAPKKPVCPYAKFGEDGSNPECRLVKQLFIRRPGKLLPSLLNVTAINIKHVNRYFYRLLDDMKSVNHVVTRITATTSKSKNGFDYPEFHFAAVGELSDEQKVEMDQYIALVKPMLMNVEVTAEDVAEDVAENDEEPF
jgi:hypothetical protein